MDSSGETFIVDELLLESGRMLRRAEVRYRYSRCAIPRPVPAIGEPVIDISYR